MVVGNGSEIQVIGGSSGLGGIIGIVFVVSNQECVAHLRKQSAVRPAFPISVSLALIDIVSSVKAEGYIAFVFYIIKKSYGVFQAVCCTCMNIAEPGEAESAISSCCSEKRFTGVVPVFINDVIAIFCIRS